MEDTVPAEYKFKVNHKTNKEKKIQGDKTPIPLHDPVELGWSAVFAVLVR